MARIISLLLVVMTIMSVAVAMAYGVLMLSELNDGNRALARAVMLGPFCPREVFTERGWRHRNVAVLASIVAFVSFAVWGIVNLGRS
jgi:hypothetical protein